MFSNLKKEIEEDFNKEENYNAILSKANKLNGIKKPKIRYILIPICIFVIAIVGVNQIKLLTSKKMSSVSKADKWIIKEVHYNSNDEHFIENASAVEKKWREKGISEQFYEVSYNDDDYTSRITKISTDNIETNLGKAILNGFDSYEKKEYNIEGVIYSIKNISSKCAIAVKFADDSDYYVYVNSMYRPKTLEEFMENLNLRELTTFGTVYYEYFEKDENDESEYVSVEFPNVDNNAIWNMLFDETNIQNVYNDKYEFHKVIGISVNIPLLGYKNISIALSEEGYLQTNILDTGKTFYIGKEKVENFLNYIIENYDGYRTIYIDDNENKETEEKDEEDDKIMMYDRVTNTYTEVTLNKEKNNNSTMQLEPFDPTVNN